MKCVIRTRLSTTQFHDLQKSEICSHLRAILCKNQAKWEMKNFDLPSIFACN